MNIAVIGAGPAGLTAAYVLARATPNVHVYEASSSVGGMARSFELWGQTVDLGPHRYFSRDKRVNQLWLEVVGNDYAMVNRTTRILHKGRFFNYPLDALDALPKLGLVEALRCGLSYAKEKTRRSSTGDSFESWVCQRFGKRLFEIFFKSYSEKLWGIPCSELDADFAAQRIKKFSLGAAIQGALRARNRAQHRTLVDQFAYPLGGTGMVYERMAKSIEDRGGTVLLRTPVQRVLVKDDRAYGIEMPNGEQRHYDTVISTMPLTHLVTRIPDVPSEIRQHADRLTFRNTIVVYLEVMSDGLFDDNWVYVQDPDVLAGRITNFRNWVPELYGERTSSILALEYWCNNDDSLWSKADETLIDLAQKEIRATTLVGNDIPIERGAVYRIPKCYPVYRRGYRDELAPVQKYLSGIDGLQAIGRYGAFKYNNQDHSILMGLLAADNVLNSQENDLWGVNCDYDSYQEECRITETGLVVGAGR
jgi:protoporphyrinogen oxidase